MSRFAYAAATSASNAPQLKFRILADITMTSTHVYVCTGMNKIYARANTYVAVGPLGGIEQVQESVDMFPRAVRMWLRAVNSADLTEPMTENLFNKDVILYRAFLDSSFTVVSTPEQMFRGKINAVNVHLADPVRGNFFEIEVESRLRKEPRSARFNKESLWQVYSGDTFFNFVDQIPGFRSFWGTRDTLFNTGVYQGWGGRGGWHW